MAISEPTVPVHVHRGPMGAGTPPRSWFGGAPALGPIDWPRDPHSGLPLHFLAQICLSELHAIAPDLPLPDTGVLAFFCDTGLEGYTEPPAFPAAVIFADAPGAQTDVPDDTPPLYGTGCHHHFRYHSSLVPAPGTFLRVPMAFRRFDVAPDHGQDDLKTCFGPKEQGEIKASALRAWPGGPEPWLWQTARLWASTIVGERERCAENLAAAEASVAHMEDRIAELSQKPSVWTRLIGGASGRQQTENPDAARFRRSLQGTAAWAERLQAAVSALEPIEADTTAWAMGHDPWAPMDDADRAEFAKRVAAAGPAIQMSPSPGASLYKTRDMAWDTLSLVLRAAPDGTCPAEVLEALDDRPFAQGWADWHQIGGAGTSVQGAPEAHADKFLLFQAAADDVLQWMWGDVGVLQFWVDPVDARNGRFDRVVMTMEAH